MGVYFENFEGAPAGIKVLSENSIFEDSDAVYFRPNAVGAGQVARPLEQDPVVSDGGLLRFLVEESMARPEYLDFDFLAQEFWDRNPVYETIFGTVEALKEALLGGQSEEMVADDLFATLYPHTVSEVESWHYVQDDGPTTAGLSSFTYLGRLLEVVVAGAPHSLNIDRVSGTDHVDEPAQWAWSSPTGLPLFTIAPPVNQWFRLTWTPGAITVDTGGAVLEAVEMESQFSSLAVSSIANTAQGVPIWYRSAIDNVTITVVPPELPPPPAMEIYSALQGTRRRFS